MNTPPGGDASSPGQRKKLPVNPSLEHLQKQAKRRTRQNPSLKLAEAQHQLAREYGCRNWAELVHVVETMARGADQLAYASAQREPLPEAVGRQDWTRAREILAAGEFTPHDLDQALAHAIWYGGEEQWPARREMADLLIEHGADPDGQYGGAYGPIVFGLGEGQQPEQLEYLLAAGADVSFPPVQTKYGPQCPLSHSLGSYVRGRNERKHRMIDLLLRHGAYVPPEVSPPILAIHRGQARELGEMLDRDPGLLTRRFPEMPYGNIELRGASLLHCAVEFGEIACVEELLRRHADINLRAEIIEGLGGQTPIFHAINTNGDDNFPMLEYLVRRVGPWIDCSVRATWRSFGEPQGTPMTPLEYAEHAARTVDPRWRKKTAEELAILRALDRTEQIRAAIRAEDEDAVRRFLAESPELLTPGLWPVAIFQAGSLSMTRLLLALGLNPNECSAPRKPLHFAVDRGRLDLLDVLLAAGADPNIRDGEGFTPLDLLGGLAGVFDKEVRREIVTRLRAAGTETNVWTLLRVGETAEALRRLEAEPALINAPSLDLGFTPLQVAARMADDEAIAWLLDHGADVNAGANPPLWLVCQSAAPAEARLAVAARLLAAGADVNQICEGGSTPLHYAAWRGPVAMAELLLQHGARNWIADDRGKNAVDYAKESAVLADREEMVQLLSDVRMKDPIFRAAVAAIDAGEVERLRELLQAHPALIHQRAEEEGWFAGTYFRHPTLLHFVANNPYRHETMPPRILESTEALLAAGADVDAPTEAGNDHTVLGLVASGERARLAGQQIPLIELLVRHGANPTLALDPAIIHGESEAVACLRQLGARLTLMAAAALGETETLRRHLRTAPERKKLLDAADAAARYGRIDSLEILCDEAGLDVNERVTPHPYTPTLLHEAAWFNQRELAAWLLARGADPTVRDSQHQGTPADWAHHAGHPELAAWLREVTPVQG